MKRTLFSIFIATLLFGAATHAADTKSINPALLYWQAAAQLPKLTDEQAKDINDIAKGNKRFDPAKAPKLGNDALDLMRKATESAATCDWGLVTEMGPFMPLPHLAKLSELSSLALVKAESLFSAGKVKEGLDWVLVTQRVARHAGAGDLLVSALVQQSIETNALRTVARHCLGWDDSTRHAYTTALQALPPLHTFHDAYGNEAIFPDWIEHHFASTTHPQLNGEQLNEVLALMGDSANKEAYAADLAPTALAAVLAEFRALHARVLTALGKPWPESHADLKALDEEAYHSSHLLVRRTFPTITHVAEKPFELATLQTMLDAALQHGAQLDDTAAATYHDAFDGKPLRWKKADDGTLSLLATLPDGKDLELTLGR